MCCAQNGVPVEQQWLTELQSSIGGDPSGVRGACGWGRALYACPASPQHCGVICVMASYLSCA